LDAYATTQSITPKDILYRNDGNLTFVDVTDAMGMVFPPRKNTMACAWADFDNDGWVDLMVGNNYNFGADAGNFLWHNEGGKRFVNVAEQMGVKTPPRRTFYALVWADFDNDNDQDFFVSGDGDLDLLYRNDGTNFVNIGDITTTDGANAGIAGRHSTGAAWGDFNNDGRLDLYICENASPNRLHRNDGDGVWPDVARQLNVNDYTPDGPDWDDSATPVWGDYDNDGDLDLFVTSWKGEFDKPSENRLYRNDGTTGFVEVGFDMGLGDQGQSHVGAAFGDIDNDGDLDLYVLIGPTQLYTGPLGGGFDLLYENATGNQNNWLEFHLTGTQSNRSAIGARIQCVSDTLSQIREVNGGTGINCFNPLTQHFGFEQRTMVDSVVIRWPSGNIDIFIDVPVNQILNITEGNNSGIETPIVMPTSLTLENNYPNPFNLLTTIKFSLPRLERVRLEVVDITGRLVRTLIDNRLLSGVHEVRWDGCTDSRQPVSSGIYICRLIQDDTVMTIRMTVLK
ncbi:VCBS repeat-containing protein, partial [bacterium]|nr:VCBS repeat-containing protein [candidate division CSSED10-310 bacterium]